MSHDEILREITSEQELAAYDGAGDGWEDARNAWYQTSQFIQCTGIKDCGGCDPNGPYRSDGRYAMDTSSGSFHC